MAICIEFELIEVIDSIAIYKYGNCLHELDHVMKFNLDKILSGETLQETPINEIVSLTSEKKSEFMAYRVFFKVYKHYRDNGEYLKKGGHYA